MEKMLTIILDNLSASQQMALLSQLVRIRTMAMEQIVVMFGFIKITAEHGNK